MRRCRARDGNPERWDSGLIDWSDGTGDGPWRGGVGMGTKLDDPVVLEELDPLVADLMRRRPDAFVASGSDARCDHCGSYGAARDGICEPCRLADHERERWAR